MATSTEDVMVRLRTIYKGSNVMKKSILDQNRLEKSTKKTGEQMKTAEKRGKNMTMALLGVGFFGQMVSTTFLGMLQPISEVFGIFELWSTMLTVVFLPIMEALFPYFLSFIEFFMGLPEPVKLAIGAFTILVGVLGTLLSYFGFIALGLGALGVTFGGVASVAATFFKFIGGLFSAFGLIISAIVFGMWLAWKENFGNMRDWVAVIWEGIKNIFKGAIDIIKGIWKIFTSLLKGDFDGVVEGIKQVFTGLWTFLKGIVETILGVIVSISLGIWRVITGVWETFVQGVLKAWGVLKNVWKWVKDKLNIGGGGSGSGNLSQDENFNDFIWRPGQAPAHINPQDTVVGFKGAPPAGILGGGGSGVTVNATYNITVSDRAELERMMREHDRRLSEEIRRQTGARAA